MERSGKRDVATPERPYLFRSHRDYFGAVRLAMTHAFVDMRARRTVESPSPAIRKTHGNGTDGKCAQAPISSASALVRAQRGPLQ
jgi:hypothetical protein